MVKHILSLDYSTSATGWARFEVGTKKLLEYGVLLPDFKGRKLEYPELQVLKLERLAEQLLSLINEGTELIVIEEINGGSRASRISQKVLDGGHFIFLSTLPKDMLKKIVYIDSDGSCGWRSKAGLALQLSQLDKDINKERKKLNKKRARKEKKLPLITQKTLACRYVNKRYGMSLDCDLKATDGDIADAIGLGTFYVEHFKHD